MKYLKLPLGPEDTPKYAVIRAVDVHHVVDTPTQLMNGDVVFNKSRITLDNNEVFAVYYPASDIFTMLNEALP